MQNRGPKLKEEHRTAGDIPAHSHIFSSAAVPKSRKKIHVTKWIVSQLWHRIL